MQLNGYVATTYANNKLREAGIRDFGFTIKSLKRRGFSPVLELPRATYWKKQDLDSIVDTIIKERKASKPTHVTNLSGMVDAYALFSEIYKRDYRSPVKVKLDKFGIKYVEAAINGVRSKVFVTADDADKLRKLLPEKPGRKFASTEKQVNTKTTEQRLDKLERMMQAILDQLGVTV